MTTGPTYQLRKQSKAFFPWWIQVIVLNHFCFADGLKILKTPCAKEMYVQWCYYTYFLVNVQLPCVSFWSLNSHCRLSGIWRYSFRERIFSCSNRCIESLASNFSMCDQLLYTWRCRRTLDRDESLSAISNLLTQALNEVDAGIHIDHTKLLHLSGLLIRYLRGTPQKPRGVSWYLTSIRRWHGSCVNKK